MTQPGPQWKPRTEAELQHAAEDGLLEETHYLDLKQTLEPGKSANKKFAADIAAFALDGGVIVIGVEEGEDGAPHLKPIVLTGLPERVETIARTAVHEPVQITSTRITAADSAPGYGYLVVHIPQSPRAPHMADGRFYGRGDKTNRVLPQEEVLRLHERRLRGRGDIIAATHRAIEGLGIPQGHNSILAILAEPLGADEDLLVPLAAAGNWQQEILQLLQSALQPSHRNYAPSFADSPGFGRRAGGVTVTKGMYNGRRWEGTGRAAEITFHENGSLLLASERAVWTHESRVQPPQPSVEVIFETLIIGHLDLLTRLVARVADKYGFTGSWRFGMVITGLNGAYALTLDDGWGPEGPPYTAPTYERATMASLLDLTTNPRAVTETLVASLLRSIGSYPRWKKVFTDPDSPIV
ncbi:ATP-binding protein [Nocardia beijingensis]|uniref:AlbA family DNA-binding domain-containing protein n=1 Tax=Nocardia beijingensis TaxID=95162 RepID=UPI00331A427F